MRRLLNPGWRTTLLALISALALSFGQAGEPAAADELIVFAAASLRTGLDEAARQFTAQTGETVLVSYAGTPTLARQIALGAPADIFIAADSAWMDEVEGQGLIRPGTRRDLLGNALVLIGPRDLHAPIAIGPDLDLVTPLGDDGRLALADTRSVPAGRYARAALEYYDAWRPVAGRTVETDNVRTALALVARGEAPLGIVYATDAAAEPAVAVLGTFPANSHPPIVYPISVMADSAHAAADAFVDYLGSGSGRAAFEKQGFSIVAPGS